MSGNDYMNSSETCDVSDYTWALHYLLQATKNPIYADRIERCVFNSGIGAVLEDFKGLQYFSCANQIIADENSNHNSFFKGSEWMRYCPNPGTECCAGNVNRFMPNYVLNSWYREENNIYAFLYCASEYNTEINGKNLSIIEETDYTIKEQIVFNIKTEIEFNFYFRIPSFCSDSIIKKDGETVSVVRNGSYMKLSIKQDCTIELYFESQIQEHIKRNSIFFTKGCLIYSYGMKGKRKIVTYDKDGNKKILYYYRKNDTFGEVFFKVYMNRELFVLAKKKCKVLFYPYDLAEYCTRTCMYHIEILRNLPDLILHSIAEQNFRMILLTYKSVRDKLLTYFNLLSVENNSKTFELPFSLTDLADYLIIERTAMMRELKRLKDEKKIKKIKNKITLL